MVGIPTPPWDTTTFRLGTLTRRQSDHDQRLDTPTRGLENSFPELSHRRCPYFTETVPLRDSPLSCVCLFFILLRLGKEGKSERRREIEGENRLG